MVLNLRCGVDCEDTPLFHRIMTNYYLKIPYVLVMRLYNYDL